MSSCRDMPVIVHLSDVHFGAQTVNLAESLLADVVSQGPDLVVVSGDLTQRARRDEFRSAEVFLKRLPGPVLRVVGNHDIPLFDLPRRFVAPTRRYQRYIDADLDPVVVLPDLVAVGLDTMPAWRWKAGHVSQRQVDFMRDGFRDSPLGAWRLLVTHHPVLPAELSGLRGRNRLVVACAEVDVTILLSGHIHTSSIDLVSLHGAGVQHRALAVVAGTATSRRTRGTSNAYGLLNLAGPMEAGATLSAQIRESVGSGWVAVRTDRFVYTPEGVTASDI